MAHCVSWWRRKAHLGPNLWKYLKNGKLLRILRSVLDLAFISAIAKSWKDFIHIYILATTVSHSNLKKKKKKHTLEHARPKATRVADITHQQEKTRRGTSGSLLASVNVGSDLICSQYACFKWMFMSRDKRHWRKPSDECLSLCLCFCLFVCFSLCTSFSSSLCFQILSVCACT